jgi:hypothetical protein
MSEPGKPCPGAEMNEEDSMNEDGSMNKEGMGKAVLGLVAATFYSRKINELVIFSRQSGSEGMLTAIFADALAAMVASEDLAMEARMHIRVAQTATKLRAVHTKYLELRDGGMELEPALEAAREFVYGKEEGEEGRKEGEEGGKEPVPA